MLFYDNFEKLFNTFYFYKSMKYKDSLIIFIKGLFMGVADIIPGVSGGTIAFITGIYDRLISSINGVVNIPVEKSFKKVDFKFLIPLALGIIISLFLMANLILLVLDYSVALVYSLFTGLILASALVILKNQKSNFKNYSFAFLGIVIGFSTGFIGFQLSNTLPVLFLSGFIAISAMILPGISGAFLLLILGQYEYLLNVLRNITTDYFEALIFILGAVTGLILLIKIQNYLKMSILSINLYTT